MSREPRVNAESTAGRSGVKTSTGFRKDGRRLDFCRLAGARFAPQAGLFASLTLRAARNYVRYSAALRSYSGFVDDTETPSGFRLQASSYR